MPICPTCGGGGVGYVLVAHSTLRSGQVDGFVEKACSDCVGSGEISDERAAWKTEGEKLRAFRNGRDMSLREAAGWLGISPVEWSEAEHGKVDPNRVRTLVRTREIARDSDNLRCQALNTHG